VQVVVKNPATGLPFPNNQIPSNLLDPVGSKLAAFYPLVSAGTSPTGQFVANDPATTVVDDYVSVSLRFPAEHCREANSPNHGQCSVTVSQAIRTHEMEW
jgi:hypothetical protein